MDFDFDTKDFDEKIKKLVGKVMPEKIERGLGVAMLDLLNSCITEVPTVPLKEGWLRGSGSIFVQNKFMQTSEGMDRAKAGYATKSYSEFIPKETYVGFIGFNTPYAARLHEGVGFHFTEGSSGPKYLESKLMTKRDVLIGDIADAIKN